jgi:hypothetical protein
MSPLFPFIIVFSLFVMYQSSTHLPKEQLLREKRTTKLGDGCDAIYLDIGSNIGVQVRKLYEPERYPGAEVLKQFDRIYGLNRSHVCSFGFEANPRHVKRLRWLESYNNEKGWKTKFFVPMAVSNIDKEEVDFFEDDIPSEHFWSSSLSNEGNKTKRVSIPSLNIGRFIMDELVGRRGNGPVYAKFDIEGAEYNALGSLIANGAICHITHASIEFHHPKNEIMRGMLKDLPLLSKQLGCQPMTFDKMDDESFRHDHDSSQ